MTSILYIEGVRDDQLHGSFVTDRGVITAWAVPDTHLDQRLMPQLLRMGSLYRALTGIAVRTDQLGGFASSRIILTTLNAIAFTRDIPIVAVRHSLRALMAREYFKRFARAHFTNIVVPQYDHPAHITVSRKATKFTISR